MQATSATTGKMPLSPGTQGTSIISQESPTGTMLVLWTASATTGKMPLSPGTQGTSIISQESLTKHLQQQEGRTHRLDQPLASLAHRLVFWSRKQVSVLMTGEHKTGQLQLQLHLSPSLVLAAGRNQDVTLGCGLGSCTSRPVLCSPLAAAKTAKAKRKNKKKKPPTHAEGAT
ncbi:hypothetical protein GGTG_04753 [Gaeumannomyces tritici R3-111a-1]|uniref:Uncharacterized protein n=1 Tax=Gaeumannomyces tritici (strain R3-111a-1) TaxID=644352 RepID=J3NU04_GAET3|nr:hypothetical protein GGTG_04753 [Gaeumannomyces tritici R3-111a-1]EJT79669.1 hypothetical protein GGTG_04753 [Gaeumannomyces tritici R3-111a-1]